MRKQRWTATDKWDDDWFLELPPVMKCAWEYIRDNVDGGTGIMKISFRKMSDLIKGEVTRDEFEKHIGSRVHWIDDSTIWLPGYLRAQFKNLSQTNKAHVNMARNVIAAVGGQVLSERTQKYFDELMKIAALAPTETLNPAPDLGGPSLDPPGTLQGPSLEGPQTLIGYRIKDKGYSSERGSGGKPSSACRAPPLTNVPIRERQATILREALKKFGTGTRAQTEIAEFLGPELHQLAVKAGIHRIRQLPDDQWYCKSVARMLEAAASSLECQTASAG